MATIRERLAALAEALGLNKPLRARARRRYKANRKRAYKAERAKERAQAKADKLRAAGHMAAAAKEDRAVARARQRATKNHDRAQHFLGVVKRLSQRIHGLEQTAAELEAKAAAFRKAHGIKVEGDKVTGGNPRKRVLAAAHASAANCASGKRKNFYSQSGAYDVDHCITGPASGHHDDCSSWETSAHKSADMPDPNGARYTGGYTGTMRNGKNARLVRRQDLKGGEAVLYGAFPYHHTEMVDDPQRGTTIGHGSAPVDAGVIDLFGPDEEMTFVSYYDD